MTSKLRCPVCPYCNKLLHCNGTQYINEHIVAMWHCQNPECEQSEDLIGTREMWEIVANKIQAKQDLEIATKALEEYADEDMWENCCKWDIEYMQGLFLEHGYEIAKEALEQIEQKEERNESIRSNIDD